MNTSLATEVADFSSLNRNTPKLIVALPPVVEQEIERLTESLFLSGSAPQRRSIVLVDMDSGVTSSLWLAVAMSAALSNTLKRPVYVLASASEPVDQQTSHLLTQAANNNVLIEYISNANTYRSTVQALANRLEELYAEGHPVIIHLPHTDEQSSVLARTDLIEGVVLVARASRTRRAALDAVQRSLAASQLLLLGSVLLDRVYPIPQFLYRLL